MLPAGRAPSARSLSKMRALLAVFCAHSFAQQPRRLLPDGSLGKPARALCFARASALPLQG